MGRWEHTAGGDIAAEPERIWALWADAAQWPRWHHNIKSATLDGPLRVGAIARIRFKGSLRPTTFRVLELEEHRLFTDEGKIPGGRIRHVHRITPTGDGTCWVEHVLTITGPLAGLWGMLLGRRMRDAVDDFVPAEAHLAMH